MCLKLKAGDGRSWSISLPTTSMSMSRAPARGAVLRKGVIRRHGFGGGPKSHGHMLPRCRARLGASSFPSRVFPGQRNARAYGRGEGHCPQPPGFASVDLGENLLMVEERGAWSARWLCADLEVKNPRRVSVVGSVARSTVDPLKASEEGFGLAKVSGQEEVGLRDWPSRHTRFARWWHE